VAFETKFSDNQNQNSRLGKKLIIISIILVAALLVGLFFVLLGKQGIDKFTNQKSQNTQKTPQSARVFYDPAKGYAPGFVAAGLPLDKPLDIADNSSVKSPDESFTESTLTYVTSMSMQESIAAYKKYFADKKWAIDLDTGAGQFHTILGSRQQEKLSFTFTLNTASKKNYITLVYRQPELSKTDQDFIKQLQEQTKK